MKRIYYSLLDFRHYVNPQLIKSDVNFPVTSSVTELLKRPDLFELLTMTKIDFSEDEDLELLN